MVSDDDDGGGGDVMVTTLMAMQVECFYIQNWQVQCFHVKIHSTWHCHFGSLIESTV